MPRPTRADIEQDLQGLTPEQQIQYMDELERRFPPTAVEDASASPDIRPAFNRFVEGAASTALPSMDTVGQLAGAATDTPMGVPSPVIELGEDGKIHIRPSKSLTLGWDILKGMAKSHGEQFGKAGESARAAAELGASGDIGGAARKTAATVGHTVAGLTPLVGPAAAHAGERISEGDVAGGLGEATGLGTVLLPFGKKFAAGIETRTAKGLESSAGRNIAKVVGARWQEVPDIMQNTETIAKGLGVGNREKLLNKVKGVGALSRKKGANDPSSLLGRAETKLDLVKAKGADIPIGLERAAQGVRDIAIKLDNPRPGPRSLDRELVAATEDWASQIEGKAFAHGTEGTSPTPPIPPSRTLGGKDIPGVPGRPGTPDMPGEVPASEVFKLRTQAGDVASRKGGFKANPLGEVTATGKAAAAAHGELGSLLKEAVPGLREADLNYSSWRQVGDLLQASTQKGALKNAPALELLGLRVPIGGILGMTMAGGAGAAVGGTRGALFASSTYGALQVAREIANSAYWQSLSAATKIKVANAIKSGALTTAEVATRGAGVAVPAVSRYTENQQE